PARAQAAPRRGPAHPTAQAARLSAAAAPPVPTAPLLRLGGRFVPRRQVSASSKPYSEARSCLGGEAQPPLPVLPGAVPATRLLLLGLARLLCLLIALLQLLLARVGGLPW